MFHILRNGLGSQYLLLFSLNRSILTLNPNFSTPYGGNSEIETWCKPNTNFDGMIKVYVSTPFQLTLYSIKLMVVVIDIHSTIRNGAEAFQMENTQRYLQVHEQFICHRTSPFLSSLPETTLI